MTFWRTFYHLVWTTRNREPLITAEIEPHLFQYLIRQAAQMGVHFYAVNGWSDHVHLVAAIPPHVAVADFVKQLKGASSHDLNQRGLPFHFAWQRGYGVLTLGQRQLPQAEAYVRGQKEHHERQTTNAWLERVADAEDEAPASPAHDDKPALREPDPAYVTTGEPPF